jgi:hypothetical protein
MALSASPIKKRKTTDTAGQDSPGTTRGSSRLRARGSSVNYAELNEGKGKGRAQDEDEEVELNNEAKRSSRRLSSSASPTKKSSTPTRVSKASRSSPTKADPPFAPPSSSKPAGRRAQRSPSPSSSRSPVKPRGWTGWEIATEPVEQHPQKGYLSGLEILEKQGLLDQEGEKRLRNGRTVAKAVAKAKGSGRDGSEGRWGEDEEEDEEVGAEDELEVDRPEEEEQGEMDWQDETSARQAVVAHPVAGGQSLDQDRGHARLQQPSLSSHVLAHLPVTKTLVMSHLTGRVPPRPSRSDVVDIKGKGRAQALAGRDTSEDVNAESVRTLVDLLKGTVERGEGNSCLIQGVKGGGKTTVRNLYLFLSYSFMTCY